MEGSCLRDPSFAAAALPLRRVEAGAPASRLRAEAPSRLREARFGGRREVGAQARSRTARRPKAMGRRAEGRSLRRRRAAPNTPPGDFKSPGPQLSRSKGRPWWGSKHPFGLCGSRGNGAELSALRRTLSSALGTVLAGKSPATPAAWSTLLPPSATSPGRRVAISSTFLKHRTRACTWYRPSFCPDYRA